jgi:signal transduction histidine kinase
MDYDDHRLRRAVLGTLAAELGHDLQGPVNLFRLMTERARAGESFDAEDLQLLEEELARLSRIGARLRALAHRPLVKARCCVRAIVEAAVGRIDSSRSVGLELDLPDAGTSMLQCDSSLLGLALGELIDNALAAKGVRAGVRFASAGQSGFCVWDDGAGFAEDPASALGWGTTTKAGAAGLGLTLALRAARAHGFKLEITRAASLTELWLLIPAREIETGPGKLRG